MAKQNSFIKIQGTFGGMTAVNSKTYGEHLRYPRGTHKPAVLNEVLTESMGALVEANVPAKIIKDALDPFRKNFYDGRLWTRLISNFKKRAYKKALPDFHTLEGFEIHKEHPLSRIVDVDVDVRQDLNNSYFCVTLKTTVLEKFRSKKIDGCILTVIAIYPDLVSKSAITNAVTLPVVSIGQGTIHELVFPIADASGRVLLCLKAEGCEQEIASTVLKTKGMQIIKVV